MSDQPDSSLTLYRGYVVYFHNSDELVEPVKTLSGGLLWQSRQRLEEALKKAVVEGADIHPTDTMMNKDIGGYVEEVPVSLAATRDAES